MCEVHLQLSDDSTTHLRTFFAEIHCECFGKVAVLQITAKISPV